MSGFRIKPDAGPRLQATTKAKICITSFRESARVSQLRLVRSEPRGKRRIDPRDVERTFKPRKKDP